MILRKGPHESEEEVLHIERLERNYNKRNPEPEEVS